jgi:hypothetical protein
VLLWIAMRDCRSAWVLLALALGAGCAQPTSSVPRWDANVDAPRQDSGPVLGSTGHVPSSGGSPRTTPGCYAQLLVIFDRSGSMGSAWETSTGSQPRWRVAADALTAAIEPIAGRLQVGAILFPTSSEASPGMCTVVDPIESQLDYREGPAFVDAWIDLWRTPDLRGSTPIDTAFDSADDALDAAHSVTAVVLLTDGEPTCRGPVSALDRAASWHARGIDTWVVGLPGTSGSAFLDAVASAGGTGGALSVEDPAALTHGLTEILGAQVDQACGD